MTTQKEHSSHTKRIHWMDNIRSVIIALVALYHVGSVYETNGMWSSSQGIIKQK